MTTKTKKPAAKPTKKSAPAAKPEAKAPRKVEGKAATREVIPNDAKLTVLFEENPARAGTVAAKVRDLYRTSKTVGEWREAVRARDLDAGYLQNDIRRGLIRVE